jgi:hypothetical protein
MSSFRMPTSFFRFSTNYSCSHIAETANIAKSAQYRRIVLGKNFRYIENDAYVSNFVITSQEQTVSNEITGFLTIV